MMRDPLTSVVSVVPRATEHTPNRQLTIAEALEEIRSGRFRTRVEQIRALADKKARTIAKKGLPAYIFCGRFRYVNREGLAEHSGVVCLDYDDLPDPAGTRAELVASPHALAVFESPSGLQQPGLKVLVAVTPPPSNNDQNHEAYNAAAAALGVSGVAVDETAKDLPRLCYASWDPGLYVNPAAAAVPVTYAAASVGGAGRGPGETFTRLEEGRKYETLRHLGGLLRHGGASPDVIETALQAIREAHSDDPGDAEPVAKLAEWLGERDPADYASLNQFLRDVHTEPEQTQKSAPPVPPFVPFPTWALPATVSPYVGGNAAALDVDEAAIAVPVLPAIAAAVGNSYEAEPRPGWRERPTVWAALIQPSGTKKSQCVYVAVAPALALEKEAAETYTNARELYETELEKWNELPKGKKGDKPSKPERRRYRVGDTTVESVAAVHSENTRGLLGYRDELSGWLGSMNQYNRGDSDAANWMELCGGRPLVIDRKSDDRGVLYIENPNVSMVGTIQPATLTGKLGPGHFASGFAARLLLAEPPTRPRRWTEARATPDVDAGYHETVRRLYALDEGSGVLPFTPEATEVFRAFYDANGAVLDGLPDGPLRASVSKIEGYTVRLALSFHLCDCVSRGVTPGPVSADAVERAVVVASWLRYEQARVYRLHGFDRLALDTDARKALELPGTFGWKDVADAWGVGKSGAYGVLARLTEKQIAEDAGHGHFRRMDSGRLDFVDYGISFDPLVHKVHRSTVESGTPTTGDGLSSAPPVLLLAGDRELTPAGEGTVSAPPEGGSVSVDVDGEPFSFPVSSITAAPDGGDCPF